MAENTNFSVINYLKNGKTKKPVTQRDIDSYFKDYVLSSPNLPLHYKRNIDIFLKEISKGNNISGLMKYISEELNGVVFCVESENVILKGLKNLLHHPEYSLILEWLEEKEEISRFFNDNFSLYPIFIDTNITIRGKDIYDVSIVSIDWKGIRLGIIGGLNLDYDLAAGILDYLIAS